MYRIYKQENTRCDIYGLSTSDIEGSSYMNIESLIIRKRCNL